MSIWAQVLYSEINQNARRFLSSRQAVPWGAAKSPAIFTLLNKKAGALESQGMMYKGAGSETASYLHYVDKLRQRTWKCTSFEVKRGGQHLRCALEHAFPLSQLARVRDEADCSVVSSTYQFPSSVISY